MDSSIRRLFCCITAISFPPIQLLIVISRKNENVKEVLEKVNPEHHNWDVYGDFKMLGFLRGLQGGHVKYYRFLCHWNSSATDQHYVQRKWQARKQPLSGTHNVIHEALVPTDKILQLRTMSAM
jgi:hypothetical protein